MAVVIRLSATQEMIYSLSTKKTKNATPNTNQENLKKYWSAAEKVHPYRDEVYSAISKFTGINDYENFPPEAKAIAAKMNDFCNSMTAGKMVSAMQSPNIDDELKSLLNEVKKNRDECMNELNQLYGEDNSKNKNANPFNIMNNNPFST